MAVIRTPIRQSSPAGAKSPIGRMTEQEFIDWCDSDTWAEWVNGEVVLLSPVNTQHARFLSFFIEFFRSFVSRYDLGEVFNEPFQVRFPKLRTRRSPDLIFISSSRLEFLKEQHFEGAPDLALEIVSPQSQSRDRREKFIEYQSAGVREYWIVDPLSKSVEAYALKGKTFQLIEEKNGIITSGVLPRFYIKPAWLWQDKLPKVPDLLKEMSAKR